MQRLKFGCWGYTLADYRFSLWVMRMQLIGSKPQFCKAQTMFQTSWNGSWLSLILSRLTFTHLLKWELMIQSALYTFPKRNQCKRIASSTHIQRSNIEMRSMARQFDCLALQFSQPFFGAHDVWIHNNFSLFSISFTLIASSLMSFSFILSPCLSLFLSVYFFSIYLLKSHLVCSPWLFCFRIDLLNRW